MEAWWCLHWYARAEASAESAICPQQFGPLHIAAYLGLHLVLQRLLRLLREREQRNIGEAVDAVDWNGRTALWWAACMGHARAVSLLMRAGADPCRPDKYSITPAHRAAAAGDEEIFRTLVSPTGRNLQVHSDDSTIGGRDEVLVDGDGWTPLHWAASRGHCRIAIQILRHSSQDRKQGLPPPLRAYGTQSHRNNVGRTAVHLAALNGHVGTVQGIARTISPLAASGTFADVANLRDANGHTAIHLAAIQGHVDVCELLVISGADPTLRDSAGRTPAELARSVGHNAVAVVLDELSAADTARSKSAERLAGAVELIQSLDIRSMESTLPETFLPERRAPLLSVSARGTTQDAETVSRSNAQMHSKPQEQGEQLQRRHDLDGQDTSLVHAVLNGHTNSLALLVRKRRQWRAEDAQRRTVLHHAAATGSLSCVRSILELVKQHRTASSGGPSGQCGPKHPLPQPQTPQTGLGQTIPFVDRQDIRGWTALHFAVAGCFDVIVVELLLAGAETDLTNDEGMTAYDLAVRGGHRETIEAISRYATALPTERLSKDLQWTDAHRQAYDGSWKPGEQDDGTQLRRQLQQRDILGRLPIFCALERRHWDVARSLADATDPFELSDIVDCATVVADESRPIFSSSSETDHRKGDMLQYLVARLPPFSLAHAQGDLRGRSHQLLVVAARRNDVASVEHLLTAGVSMSDVHDRTDRRWQQRLSALHVAIVTSGIGRVEAALLMIANSTPVDLGARTAEGYTALHLACEPSICNPHEKTVPQPAIVAALLDRGADPNVERVRPHCQIGKYQTPLELIIDRARLRQFYSKFDELEAAGDAVIRTNQLECARMLLAAGAEPMAPSYRGWVRGATVAWEALLQRDILRRRIENLAKESGTNSKAIEAAWMASEDEWWASMIGLMLPATGPRPLDFLAIHTPVYIATAA